MYIRMYNDINILGTLMHRKVLKISNFQFFLAFLSAAVNAVDTGSENVVKVGHDLKRSKTTGLSIIVLGYNNETRRKRRQ